MLFLSKITVVLLPCMKNNNLEKSDNIGGDRSLAFQFIRKSYGTSYPGQDYYKSIRRLFRTSEKELGMQEKD